jgi:hypothetical protein
MTLDLIAIQRKEEFCGDICIYCRQKVEILYTPDFCSKKITELIQENKSEMAKKFKNSCGWLHKIPDGTTVPCEAGIIRARSSLLREGKLKPENKEIVKIAVTSLVNGETCDYRFSLLQILEVSCPEMFNLLKCNEGEAYSIVNSIFYC